MVFTEEKMYCGIIINECNRASPLYYNIGISRPFWALCATLPLGWSVKKFHQLSLWSICRLEKWDAIRLVLISAANLSRWRKNLISWRRTNFLLFLLLNSRPGHRGSIRASLQPRVQFLAFPRIFPNNSWCCWTALQRHSLECGKGWIS